MTNQNKFDAKTPNLKQVAISENRFTSTKMSEEDFMALSERWQQLRDTRMKIDGYRCAKCGASYNLQVHHTNYPQIWGLEKPKSDLVTLCDKCHLEVHGK